jgi:hypothetical protein
MKNSLLFFQKQIYNYENNYGINMKEVRGRAVSLRVKSPKLEVSFLISNKTVCS